MKSKFKIRMTLILISFMAIAFFPGCSDNGSDSGGNVVDPSATVQGQAYFNGPIEGATVRILDSTGEMLASEDGATDEEGNFSILVFDLPQSFFIEVEGGGVNEIEYGQVEDPLGPRPPIVSVTQMPFKDMADRYVEDFDANIRYSVNILSSIVMDLRFAKINPDDAEKYLSEYIGLPS